MLHCRTDFDVDNFVLEQLEAIVQEISLPSSSNPVLLGRFLISMTLKDLSFVVQLVSTKVGCCSSYITFENRSEGTIAYKGKWFRFRIIPIDLDQKLWKSISKWEKLERQIQEFYFLM
jgi:hypothetical protein